MNVCANRHASLLRFDIKGWTSFAYSRGISFKSFPRYYHHLFFFASFLPYAACSPAILRLFFLFFFFLFSLSSFSSIRYHQNVIRVIYQNFNDSEFEQYRLYHVFSRIEQTVQLTALRHLFSSLVRLESWRGIVSKRFFFASTRTRYNRHFLWKFDRSSDLSSSFRNKLIWTVSDDATDDRTLNVEFSTALEFYSLDEYRVARNSTGIDS